MNKKDNSRNSNFFDGLLLTTMSVVFLLIIFGAFKRSGAILTKWLVGFFGFSIYAYFIAMLTIGILKFFNFSFRATIRTTLMLMGVLVMIILLSHTSTTSFSPEYINTGLSYGENYSTYLLACLHKAQSAGGVLAGIIVYPLLKINKIAVYLLFGAILIFLIATLIMSTDTTSKLKSFFMFRTNKKSSKKEKVIKKVVGNELYNADLRGNNFDDQIKRKRKSSAVEYKTIESQELEYAENQNISKGELVYDDIKDFEDREYREDIKKPLRPKNKRKITKIDKHVEPSDEDLGLSNLYKDPTASNDDKDLNKKKALDILFKDIHEFEREEQIEDQKVEIIEESNEPIDPIDLLYPKGKKSIIKNKKTEVKVEDKIEPKLSPRELREKEIKEAVMKTYDSRVMKENLKRNLKTNNYSQVDNLIELDEKMHDETHEKIEVIEQVDYEPINNREITFDDVIVDDLIDESNIDNSEIEDKTEHVLPLDFADRLKEIEDEKPAITPEHKSSSKVEILKNKGYIDVTDDTKDEYELQQEKKEKEEKTKKAEPLLPKTSEKFVNRFKKLDLNQEVEIEEEEIVEEKPKLIRFKPYSKPMLDLLLDYDESVDTDDVEIENNIEIIVETLRNFKIDVEVVNTIIGPAFTRFELDVPINIPVNKILSREDDLKMRLGATNIFIQAPIPGKKFVGIEVPNKKRKTVGLKSVLDCDDYKKDKQQLSIAIGKDIDGTSYVVDLAKLPHLLIAGATGSGKSVGINTLLISLIMKYSPEYLRLLLVDPKKVELTMYDDIPHMLIPRSISDPSQVLNMLDWAIEEMERRYELFQESRVQNITGYNKVIDKRSTQSLPYIVIVVDEVADIVSMLKRQFEDRIARLAAKSRACGIHIVLATQRPSVDVITGTIKANLPARIAFTTSSQIDSKTILDVGGAEKLLRDGDMLLSMAQFAGHRRVQGAYIDGLDEIIKITDYIRDNNDTYFDKNIEDIITTVAETSDINQVEILEGEQDPREEELFQRALLYCIEQNKASASMLQTRFSIGYNRASKYMLLFQDYGYIETNRQASNKGAVVIITMKEFLDIYGEVTV